MSIPKSRVGRMVPALPLSFLPASDTMLDRNVLAS
jgi:hypothetical protein